MLSNKKARSKETDGTVVEAMTVPFLKDWIPGLLFLLFLFMILQYGIGRIYGFIIFPDEFGYWAAAAKMRGYDWSGVSSLGAYYSFGYGFLLFPLFLLNINPVLLYRAGLYLNFLLLGMAFVLLILILKKLFPDRDKKQILYIGMAGILYSSWIFYMQITLSEILLMSIYLLIVYFLQIYLENPKMPSALCLAGAFVYLYFVHMRTVAVLAAGGFVLMLLFVFQQKYRKSIVLLCLTAGIFFTSGFFVKQDFIRDMYSGMEASALAVNDYAGQWNKIMTLLSLENLQALLESCIGKLFYLGISTFGLFYWGMFFLLKRSVCFIQGRCKGNPVYFFILLSMLGQFAVSALFMMGGNRADTVIYGRYNEIILPLVMCLGIMEMLQSAGTVRKTALLAAVQGIFTILIVLVWSREGQYFSHACFIIGVNYAMDRYHFSPVTSGGILIAAGSILYFVAAFVIRAIRKNSSLSWLLCLLILIQLIIGWKAYEDYIVLHNQLNYQDVMLGMEIKELAEEGRKVYFSVTEESAQYIDLLQFVLGEVPIELFDKEDLSGKGCQQDTLIITYKNNDNIGFLDGYYGERTESTHFYAYYNL